MIHKRLYSNVEQGRHIPPTRQGVFPGQERHFYLRTTSLQLAGLGGKRCMSWYMLPEWTQIPMTPFFRDCAHVATTP